MYYLIHEYAGWSHSELLGESDDLDALREEYQQYVDDTLKETDSTTDALAIENNFGDVLIEHVFTEEPND